MPTVGISPAGHYSPRSVQNSGFSSEMNKILILNLVGVLGSVSAWALGMGWRFLPVAGLLAIAAWIGNLEGTDRKAATPRSDAGDYLQTSLGWHITALSLLGIGDWKLSVLGIGLGLALYWIPLPNTLQDYFFSESEEAEFDEIGVYEELIRDHLEANAGVAARNGYVAVALAARALSIDPGSLVAFELARPGGGLLVLSRTAFPLLRGAPTFVLGARAMRPERTLIDVQDQVFIAVADLASHLHAVSEHAMKNWASEPLLYFPTAEYLSDLSARRAKGWAMPLEDILGELEAALKPDSKVWLERSLRAEERKRERSAPVESPPTPAASAPDQEDENAQAQSKRASDSSGESAGASKKRSEKPVRRSSTRGPSPSPSEKRKWSSKKKKEKKDKEKTKADSKSANDIDWSSFEDEMTMMAPILVEWGPEPSEISDAQFAVAIRFLAIFVAIDQGLFSRFLLICGSWKPMSDDELRTKLSVAADEGKALLAEFIEAQKSGDASSLVLALSVDAINLQGLATRDIERLVSSIGLLAGDASTASRAGLKSFLATKQTDPRGAAKQFVANIFMSLF